MICYSLSNYSIYAIIMPIYVSDIKNTETELEIIT